MKINNLRFDKGNLIRGVAIGFVIIAMGGSFIAYSHNDQYQICEENINNSNIFTNENGDTCCRFDVGEHVIEISRHDVYRKIENVDGYCIDEVEINNWKYSNKVRYINIKPVIAIGTTKNGKLQFNDFGTVEKTNIK